MTDNVTPLYSMTMKAGESLMHDLERNLAAIANAQIKTKTRFQNWKAVIKQPEDTQSVALVEAGMLGFFLDFLFGMPMFSGMTDTAKGLLDVGLMSHSDQGRANRNMPSMAALNALISDQGKRRDSFLSQQTAQTAQMKKMRQMVMMMIMMMMQQESEEGSSGSGENVAPDLAQDVLRHPKLARFKQNRHSLSCIREMFNAQAGSVTPTFNAPRCQAA